MKKVNLIVIIPVGPTTNLDFLLDTIDSVKFYCDKSQKIILTNDSHRAMKLNLKKLSIDVVDMKKPMGKQSGLFFSLCKGIEFALKNYDFQLLLRMDDDALVTGFNPEKDALNYFKKYPQSGMLGSYRVDWQNNMRSFTPPRDQIIKEVSVFWKIINTIRKKEIGSIAPIVNKATRNGYQLGEHVLGGVYFMSRDLINRLSKNKLLSSSNFVGSKLEEDHIFGMLSYVVNLGLADFVTGKYPMCLKWKGMPTSPQEIIRLKKKVIHSTRYYKDMDETAIRKVFKSFRKKCVSLSINGLEKPTTRSGKTTPAMV